MMSFSQPRRPRKKLGDIFLFKIEQNAVFIGSDCIDSDLDALSAQ